MTQTNLQAKPDYSTSTLSRRSALSVGLSLTLFSVSAGRASAVGAQRNVTQARTVWDIDTAVGTHPVVQDGIVFSISNEGVVQAHSTETGANIWRRTLGVPPFHSSLGISGNMLLAGGRNGPLVAIDYESGEEQWRRTLSGDVLAVAPAGDNTIVTSRGAVQSVRTSDGLINWRTEIKVYNDDLRPSSSYPFSGTPVILGNSVFVRTKNGAAALTLADGEVIWRATDPGDTPENGHGLELAVVGDQLFFVSTVLTAVDIETGEIQRVTEFENPIRRGFGVEHGLVGPVTNGELVFTGANGVYAVDAGSGETVWEGGGVPYPWHGLAYDEEADNLFISAVTDGSDTLSVISLKGDTGTENWRLTIGEVRRSYILYASFISRVVMGDDTVYVGFRGESTTLSAIGTQRPSVEIGETPSTVTERPDAPTTTGEPTTTDSTQRQGSVSNGDAPEQSSEYRGLVSNNPSADIGNQFGDMYLLTLVSTALSIVVMLGQAFRRGGD